MVDKANEEFHRLIYANGGSPKLGLFLGIALRYVPNAEDANIAGWADATAHDHKDILEAFLERDADRARDAMVAHIEHAKRLLLSHLEAARAQQPQEGFR
jgi:DNA-binding GntR family transcriptional regulator